MKHKTICKTEKEELVYENLLKLGECIVTPKLRHMNYYLSSFYDKEEEKKIYEENIRWKRKRL